MFESIADISITTEQDGVVVIQQKNKAVIESGNFPVLLFSYQTWNEKKQTYNEEEYLLIRYQKKNEHFVPIAKFRISNKEQATKIAETLLSF